MKSLWVAMLAFALGACEFSVQRPAPQPQPSAGSGATSPAAPREAIALPDFTQLMKRDGPAVVNIISTNKPGPARRGQPPQAQQEEDPMLEFFRRFIPDLPPGGPGGQPRAG